tara:strand:- start:95 stop:415 length:321 start_codon:yes stop_codon:yes gene_type:complete
MSFYEKSEEILANWDKNEFRKLFHNDFLFIREAELVTLDDHMDNLDEWMTSSNASSEDRKKMMAERRRNSLIHENLRNRNQMGRRWQNRNECLSKKRRFSLALNRK